MTAADAETRAPTRTGVQAALARRLGSAAEARWILDEVLGRNAVGAANLNSGAPIDDRSLARAEALVQRRLAGEPLQYVLGSWDFRRLELTVDPRALIPRPETEVVAGVAIDEARRFATRSGADAPPGPWLADLGTGSGAIALSLAAELGPEFSGLQVWAIDADPGALALAADNLARLASSLPHLASRVSLARGEWYSALPPDLRGRLAVIVSNPPYVSAAEFAELDPVVRCEPRAALVAEPGTDGTLGLADVEAVLRGAPSWLAPEGVVVVELAPHQAVAAAELATGVGLVGVRVIQDLAGRDRAVVARRGN